MPPSATHARHESGPRRPTSPHSHGLLDEPTINLSPLFRCHTPPPAPLAKLLPVLVESLGGPNANMPRLQAAAAGAIITFCTGLRAEWLYEPAGPPGSSLGQEAVGLVMLRSLAGLVPPSGSPCIAVREEALTAVGIVSQVRVPVRSGARWGGGCFALPVLLHVVSVVLTLTLSRKPS